MWLMTSKWLCTVRLLYGWENIYQQLINYFLSIYGLTLKTQIPTCFTCSHDKNDAMYMQHVHLSGHTYDYTTTI